MFPAHCPRVRERAGARGGRGGLALRERELPGAAARRSCCTWRRAGVMNIEGLGEAMVAQLLGQSRGAWAEDAGERPTKERRAELATRKPLVHSIADLYRPEQGESAASWSAWARRLPMRCWSRLSARRGGRWSGCCWGWGFVLWASGRRRLLADDFGSRWTR